MAKVSLLHVSKSYPGEKAGDVAAVRDVSIDVADREFVVLVGPSGCGKSTTLRMIAGLEEVTSGEITIGDRLVNDVPPKDRDIAMVFQNYALYPHMTVAENMGFALKLRKFSKTETAKRVKDAAAILGIEDLLARKPKALSGGQRQRVAVGRAIVRQPKVFLFDEPLSNLDATRRVQMRTEIKKLHQRLQATMIYVTHDQVEAMTMGDRIVVMNDGAVQQIDTPLALYHVPANLFVAGFLGSPAMNFIHGILKQERDAFVFKETGEGTIEARFDAAEHPALAGSVGKPIVLGIRPEAIQITERPKGKEQVPGGFAALVDFIEAMGAETNLHVDTGAHTIVCRGDASLVPADAGRRLYFQMQLAKAHLFDPATTLRII